MQDIIGPDPPRHMDCQAFPRELVNHRELWEHKADILALVQPMDGVAPTTDTASHGMQFAPLILVAIPTLMLFWLLRLNSRIFVTNLAGMPDAGHRATMISTFLALAKSKDADITPEERLLLIRGMFRAPGAPGDDAAPSAILENVAKAVTGRRAGI